jgi:hypothetical protein
MGARDGYLDGATDGVQRDVHRFLHGCRDGLAVDQLRLGRTLQNIAYTAAIKISFSRMFNSAGTVTWASETVSLPSGA